MPHPSLGLMPHDRTKGHPEAAARLRSERARVARLALEAAVRRDPKLLEKYDEVTVRQLLRDYERHIEQVAQALETAEDSYVTNYGEWLVPIYRRRRIPMRDFGTMILGLRDIAGTVLGPEETLAVERLIDRWRVRLKRHGPLPGDHKGNAVVRFLFKGAGIGDESVI